MCTGESPSAGGVGLGTLHPVGLVLGSPIPVVWELCRLKKKMQRGKSHPRRWCCALPWGHRCPRAVPATPSHTPHWQKVPPFPGDTQGPPPSPAAPPGPPRCAQHPQLPAAHLSTLGTISSCPPQIVWVWGQPPHATSPRPPELELEPPPGAAAPVPWSASGVCFP